MVFRFLNFYVSSLLSKNVTLKKNYVKSLTSSRHWRSIFLDFSDDSFSSGEKWCHTTGISKGTSDDLWKKNEKLGNSLKSQKTAQIFRHNWDWRISNVGRRVSLLGHSISPQWIWDTTQSRSFVAIGYSVEILKSALSLSDRVMNMSKTYKIFP